MIDQNLIEITTPYGSVVDKMVLVYIKKQGNDFIVSDGARLNQHLISEDLGSPNPLLFSRIVDCYMHDYEISKKEVGNKIFYFKKTNDVQFLPNCVFEIAEFGSQFLSGLRTTSFDKTELNLEEVEDESASDFRVTGQEYFEQRFAGRTNYSVLRNKSFGLMKRIDLIVQQGSSVNTIQFLGGGKFYFYKSQINNVKADYEMLNGTPMLAKRLAIFDDQNPIYHKKKQDLTPYLQGLSGVLDHEPIPWSKKDKALELIL